MKVIRVLKSPDSATYLRFSTCNVALDSLIQSIPSLLSMGFFILYFLFLMSILLRDLLKNSLNECLDLDFGDEDLRFKEIINRSDCLDYGGNWILMDLNFEYIG